MFCKSLILSIICGESGIRTHGTLLAYTHFPGVLLRPLGHLSLVNQPAMIRWLFLLWHKSRRFFYFMAINSQNKATNQIIAIQRKKGSSVFFHKCILPRLSVR